MGLGCLQDIEHGLWRIGKKAALHGFHDGDGLAVLSCDLVAAARLDSRVIPVRVVYLQLHKFCLGMGCEHCFQLLGGGVEGEADVFDEPLLLLFLHKGPHVVVLEKVRAALAHVVEKVEVEIACPCLAQGGLELGNGLFPGLAVDPGSVLGGKLEA